jgi:TatD DNase family protein
MTQWIDTHAHLDDHQFADDLPETLDRAAAAGIVRIVTIGTTAATSCEGVALAARHALLRAAVGIQPNHVAEAAATDWDQICWLVSQPGVVAVGETGLDRHWDTTPFPQQEDYFARHLALARQHRLPVVIHTRKSEADIVRMLRQDFEAHGPVRGVMHSYAGDAASAEACLAMGLHVSFAGMLTYKNARNVRDVAALAPLDRLLVETDSPYLAPAPVRGKRNEPAFVVHTARVLAEVKGVTFEELARQTTQNALNLFAARK